METTAAASPPQKIPLSPRTPAHWRDGLFDPPHISCPFPSSSIKQDASHSSLLLLQSHHLGLLFLSFLHILMPFPDTYSDRLYDLLLAFHFNKNNLDTACALYFTYLKSSSVLSEMHCFNTKTTVRLCHDPRYVCPRFSQRCCTGKLDVYFFSLEIM